MVQLKDFFQSLPEFKLGKIRIYSERLDAGTFNPDIYPLIKKLILESKRKALVIKDNKIGFFRLNPRSLSGSFFIKEIKLGNYDILITDEEEPPILKAWDYFNYSKDFLIYPDSINFDLKEIPEKIYARDILIRDEIKVLISDGGGNTLLEGELIKRLKDLKEKLKIIRHIDLLSLGGPSSSVVLEALNFRYIREIPFNSSKVEEDIKSFAFLSISREILKRGCPTAIDFLWENKDIFLKVWKT